MKQLRMWKWNVQVDQAVVNVALLGVPLIYLGFEFDLSVGALVAFGFILGYMIDVMRQRRQS